MPAPRATNNVCIAADVSIDDGDWSWLRDAEASVDKAVRAIPQSCFKEPGGVSVAISLSSDEIVAELNGRYRSKHKPTNVLSFPALAGSASGFLGDIIVANETVQREAAENGIAAEHHLQHLIIHGVLHLLGFDHETASEAERMEALEIEILASIGIENPYTEPLEAGTREAARHRAPTAKR